VVASELEKAGLPTALVTALTPTAIMMGVLRIVPGVSITHPLGNPDLSAKKEKELRRKIVMKAIESLKAKVNEPTVFNWQQ
jgi:glycine reductase complex component B subunit gamma